MSRVTQILTFVTVAVLLLAGIHYYFWARLVRDTGLPQLGARVLTGAIAALALSIPLGLVLIRMLRRDLPALSWVAFTWMGLMFLLLVGLAAGDVFRVAVWLAERLRGAPVDPSRRELLARAVAGGASAFAATAGVLGMVSALRQVQVKAVSIPLGKLPPALDGFTIAAISDVHLGPTIGPDFMRDVVARVNALEADAVVIVGDLVDGSVAELAASAAPLADLRAPHGVFFVTGNHEYYSGAAEWLAHLRTLGIRTLENERAVLAGAIELAGANDLAGRAFDHGPDFAKALAGRDPAKPLVLLSHQPKTFDEAAGLGVDLQISGHTHGGQIWPFGVLVRWQQGYLAGLSRRGEAQLYVSRGTGYWGPPMRVGAPAEISRLTLRAA